MATTPIPRTKIVAITPIDNILISLSPSCLPWFFMSDKTGGQRKQRDRSEYRPRVLQNFFCFGKPAISSPGRPVPARRGASRGSRRFYTQARPHASSHFGTQAWLSVPASRRIWLYRQSSMKSSSLISNFNAETTRII
jgi:hypothetical protein